MTAAEQLAIIQSIEGVDVTLSRSGSPTQPLRAVRGSTRGQITGDDGSLTLFTTVDWFMIASETGEIGKPKRGDTITIVSTGQAYTVAHPDPRSQAVVNHGNDDTAWRVHSVKEGN